jgi:transcriptional regulator with XRE-family HTH domain
MGSAPRVQPKRLAEKLHRIRLDLGLTQTQMRDLLELDEYHISYLSIWETGRREPPLSVLLKYARCVGVSTDVLIDDDVDLPTHDQVRVKGRQRKPRRRP